jgi:phage shock protein A
MSDGMTDARDEDKRIAQLSEAVARLEANASKVDTKVDMLTTLVLGLQGTLKHQQLAATHAHAEAGERLAAMSKLMATNEAISEFLLAKVSP